jgi:hypothetical protein
VGHRGDEIEGHLLEVVDAVGLGGTNPRTSITQWSPSQIAVAVSSAIRPPTQAIGGMSLR